MAASDPAIDVPTPTGTLQGVAAFSWDGSAWQPTGRAGPAVATPTGVLAGVAPFSWSGSAWTPAGRAQPGVATQSGVLDGVAVYTWSGSAWVPAGGQPTPSTPSGALRGVAAFNWDGSVWQPSAQAGPSVATPYGVLAGVAMFNWTGSAWAAATSVPAASTVFDFMTPGTLDPRITFTRTSIGTYFDVAGVMQTATANTPRWDYDPVTHALRGLFLEEQRINTSPGYSTYTPSQVTNTAASGIAPDGTNTMYRVAETATTTPHYCARTDTVTAATMYTFSLFAKAAENRYLQMFIDNGVSGGGTATFDLQTGTTTVSLVSTGGTIGTATITLVGNGVYRLTIAVQLASGTSMRYGICMSPVASPGFAPIYAGNASNGLLVWGAQLEAGTFVTSYIPTTGAAVTRTIDSAIASTSPWYTNAAAVSLSVDATLPAQGVGPVYIQFDDGTTNNRMLFSTGNNAVSVLYTEVSGAVTTATSGTAGNLTLGVPFKAAFAATAGQHGYAMNGVQVLINSSATAPPTVTTLRFGRSTGGVSNSIYLRRVQYWAQALSQTQLGQVTT